MIKCTLLFFINLHLLHFLSKIFSLNITFDMYLVKLFIYCYSVCLREHKIVDNVYWSLNVLNSVIKDLCYLNCLMISFNCIYIHFHKF